MEEWENVVHYPQICYNWQSQYVNLGVGTTSPNGRVNPLMTKQALMSKKDAGKTFIASYISRQTNKRVKLMGIEDNSPKTSRNATELEIQMKKKLTQNTFMIFKGKAYKKVAFMDSIFVPHVNKTFGTDSVESMISTQAAGDGDLWGRFSRHQTSCRALERIIDKLLWVDQ